MITTFGKFCRTLRIERDEFLKDMAKKLGVSPAYLSAVEVGKRNIPEGWTDALQKHYHLNETESEKLKIAVDMSAKQLKMNLANLSDHKKEVAVVFARRLDELSEVFKIIKE